MHRQATLQREHLQDVEAPSIPIDGFFGLRPEDGDAIVALEELYRRTSVGMN